MKRRRAVPYSLLALSLIACVAFGVGWRGYRSARANHALIQAIKTNDTPVALDALKSGADPNIRDQGEAFPSLSVYLLQLVRRMGRSGPTPPRVGPSALGLAVYHDNAVVAEALLTAGAKAAGEKVEDTVDIPAGGKHLAFSSEMTAISLMEVAARHGDAAIVKALAKHGCDVNEGNHEHATPLFFADGAETVQALIACGAYLAARDEEGRTALGFNVWASNEDAADVLLENGAYDPDAMRFAILFNHIESLERMLALGWKVDTQDRYGSTPLMEALESGGRLNLDAALILIKHGANVNHQDRGGSTPLLLAADGGRYPPMEEQSPEVVEALLKHGARIDAQDASGRTPLMIAALHRRPVLVRLLLRHGARANLRTKDGQTAFTMALRKEYARDDSAGEQAEVNSLLKNAGTENKSVHASKNIR